MLFGEWSCRALLLSASPRPFPSNQSEGPPETGHIDHACTTPSVGLSDNAAGYEAHQSGRRLDHDAHHPREDHAVSSNKIVEHVGVHGCTP